VRVDLLRSVVTGGPSETVVENGMVPVETAVTAQGAGNTLNAVPVDMQMPILASFAATTVLRQKGYARPNVALTAHAIALDRQKRTASQPPAPARSSRNRLTVESKRRSG
jgi:CheY-like chemotaxis protein